MSIGTNNKENAAVWQLWRQIINTVRQAKGLPMRETANPFIKEVRKNEKIDE